MQVQHEAEQAERIELAAERYWLEGMDLRYSKRRAQIEFEQQNGRRELPARAVVVVA
jgi:hypothetical protein